MNIKEKEKIYNKMIKKYGDLISKYTIFDVVLENNNKHEIEKEICTIYIDELEFEKTK